jgi:hypothetical protein
LSSDALLLAGDVDGGESSLAPTMDRLPSAVLFGSRAPDCTATPVSTLRRLRLRPVDTAGDCGILLGLRLPERRCVRVSQLLANASGTKAVHQIPPPNPPGVRITKADTHRSKIPSGFGIREVARSGSLGLKDRLQVARSQSRLLFAKIPRHAQAPQRRR